MERRTVVSLTLKLILMSTKFELLNKDENFLLQVRRLTVHRKKLQVKKIKRITLLN